MAALAGVGAVLAGLLVGPAAYAETDEALVPVIEVQPVIQGEAVVGGSISSIGGTWWNVEQLEFSWKVDGALVQKATVAAGSANTLKLPVAFSGKTVTLTVRAFGTAVEAAAGPVTVRPGTMAGVRWNPALSGKAAVGQTLTAGIPSWTEGAASTPSYQWFRGTEAITGAKGRSYSVVAVDVGQQIWAKATLDAKGYASAVLATAKATVAKGTFTATPVPTIAGAARVASVQTANPGAWAPTGAVLGYQWYRGSTPISGATKRGYAPVAADKGKAIKVRVTATKPGFVTVSKFSSARTIAAGVLAKTKPVTIAGIARFGQTLSVSQGWSPAPTSITYQWYRNGAAIKGATRSSLALNSTYIGSKITVKATPYRAGFSSGPLTSAAKVVGKASFTIKAAPKIIGGVSPGATLTAGNGTFSPAPTSYGFQWLRNGSAIKGAVNRVYRLTAADNGKKISVIVSARRPYYDSRPSTSAAVTVSVPVSTAISRDGTYRVGSQIRPGLYRSTGTGDGCYWERLSGFSGSFNDLTENYYGSARTYVQIVAGDVGFKTSGCGSWTTVNSSGAKATKITANGTYRVGIDMLPGTYYANGSGNSCYWETTSGFSGDFDELEENYYGSANTIVDIPSYVKGFTVHDCGTLTRR
jgi:hypothetical protein